MQWYDWTALVMVVVGTIIQTIRGSKAGGMGLPFFEAAGVAAAATAATSFYPRLAETTRLKGSLVLPVLFLLLAVLGFVVARWLFAITRLSFQSLDGFFSFMFGLVLTWAVAHMFLRVVMVWQGATGELATKIDELPVAREIYQFRTWNALLKLLFKAKLGPELDPDIG
ncbi:hypothetical protein FJY70_00750 [candidate division WOR-3 bacterium]|nr:hypothetical protein [candidate division WOR-3 bacterium]